MFQNKAPQNSKENNTNDKNNNNKNKVPKVVVVRVVKGNESPRPIKCSNGLRQEPLTVKSNPWPSLFGPGLRTNDKNLAPLKSQCS